MTRQIVQSESEFDKEKALFEQKIEYLERALTEKAVKEKSYLSELQSRKSELSSEMKTLISKNE